MDMLNEKIDIYKSYVMGMFAKCRPHTKDLAWNIVIYLSTIPENVTKVQIENHLKKTISYNLLNKLVEKEILIKINGSGRKMLVDGISEKPAYGKGSIDDMKSINYKNLKLHSLQDLDIKDIIEEVFVQYGITDIDPLSRDFIKIHNTIIDIMIDRKMYDKKYGYGRLEWRPQSANKYKLNSEYLEMFEKKQIGSLQKAMETFKQKK